MKTRPFAVATATLLAAIALIGTGPTTTSAGNDWERSTSGSATSQHSERFLAAGSAGDWRHTSRGNDWE